MNIDVFNIPLYYISFDKSLTLENMLKTYNFNNINHFPAVDGRKLTLEKLVLPHNYKGNLDNLPNNLKSLTIGYEFSSSLNNLPDSIEYIEWISIFDYKGKIMKLPKNLKEVVYGHNYETKNMSSKIRRMLLRNTKIKITDMFEVEK